MLDTEIRSLDNGLISYPALSVSPIGLTAYRISVDANGDSPLKSLGIRPPVEHQEKGFLSKKGQKSIRNAVYWFLYSVDRKLITHGFGKKKVGFLTLTLQSKQRHSDKQIKSECLNQFLTEIRSEYGVTKYIWKAEKQENGSLHFHILTDTFLPVIKMRDKWNRIINKLGYVHEYSQRMRKLTWNEYYDLRKNEKRNGVKIKIDQIRKAWKRGTREKWRNPNSIDLESLKKVKNVGAYISKYMSKEHKNKKMTKEEKELLKVDGRLWYSSESVSKMKNLRIEAFEPEFYEFVDMLADAKNEQSIYESEYTITLSVPIDKLHRQGFTEIPNRFFEYSNDVFNGFKNSEFEKEKEIVNSTAEKMIIDSLTDEKPEKEVIKQGRFEFYQNIKTVKYACDYD